jgi:peptidoglycan/xylan/chitin deacetylase (PgdA/CDA1 family)
MLTPDKLILTSENRNATLSVQILPAEAAETGIEWFSSDEAVVTVESGFLTAKGYGSAIVTAKTINDLFAEALVYVGESPLSVRLNNGVYLLPLGGEGIRVYPVFTPAESITLDYTMEVEDPSVASVDENGLLTARKIGTTSITLTTGEGLSCTSEIRVYEDVKSLFTNDDKLTIKQYEMRTISFYSETGRTFTGQLSARSDDESVCVYAGGCLLGKKPGSTVLTFTNPGTSAVCTVNVTVVENRDYPTRVLALTFDNGPDEHTREILNVLDKYGVKATFFLLGRNIELSPALAALYKDTEHELGNHTYDNSSISSGIVAETSSGLGKTDRLARMYTGKTPTLIRSSDALLPEWLFSSLLDTRTFVAKGYDMRDYNASTTAQEIVDNALSHLYNTTMLTFHETSPETVKALEILIPELIRRGYRFLTVSELIEYTGSDQSLFSTKLK